MFFVFVLLGARGYGRGYCVLTVPISDHNGHYRLASGHVTSLRTEIYTDVIEFKLVVGQ